MSPRPNPARQPSTFAQRAIYDHRAARGHRGDALESFADAEHFAFAGLTGERGADGAWTVRATPSQRWEVECGPEQPVAVDAEEARVFGAPRARTYRPEISRRLVDVADPAREAEAGELELALNAAEVRGARWQVAAAFPRLEAEAARIGTVRELRALFVSARTDARPASPASPASQEAALTPSARSERPRTSLAASPTTAMPATPGAWSPRTPSRTSAPASAYARRAQRSTTDANWPRPLSDAATHAAGLATRRGPSATSGSARTASPMRRASEARPGNEPPADDFAPAPNAARRDPPQRP